MKIPVLAVLRDERFSPNSVENDKAILLAVCAELKMQLTGVDDIRVVNEKSFIEHPSGADIILSMARSEEALSLLSGLEADGCCVVNKPSGVRNCKRSVLAQLMKENGIPTATEKGNDGFWLKRNDTSAQKKDDIVFCNTAEDLMLAQHKFMQRGINDMVVSAHIPGILAFQNSDLRHTTVCHTIMSLM